jgi:hypothetical protein
VQKPSAATANVVVVRDEEGTAGSNRIVDTRAVDVDSAVQVDHALSDSGGTAIDAPARPVRASARGYRGTLVVTSRPRGANVFVNGEWEGETPLVLRGQRAGSRALRLDLDGYTSWSRGVQVVADQSTTISATLRRED